jgi:TolB-like protein/class 3 adenylate cyclase/Flp pilus assembly protein TadD
MPEDRRLAAIMFTDIVGYTALMGSDEDKAFDMLARNHTIHETLIKKHNGTLIKEIGDGTLASFPLASNAVRCAIDIQKEAKSQKIPLKIGIHQGEMVMAGADVLGDGVNIASRLQEASHEGCITISGKVYSDIRNKAGINAKYIGEKKLKNVEDPVKMYEVLCEEEEKKEQKTSIVEVPKKGWIKLLYYIIGGLIVVIAGIFIWYDMSKDKTLPPATESITEEIDRSIAVLPFENMSGDPEQEYFCDGMTEDIITALSQFESLKVIARTSSFMFKGKQEDMREIGKKLDVAHLLEGSVRKVGNQLRITAQLIKVADGSHIWSDTYDREMEDVSVIFAIQDEISLAIVDNLKIKLLENEKATIVKRYTEDLEALYLLWYGYYYWKMKTPEGFTKAMECFEESLQKDPNCAMAYVGLSAIYLLNPFFGNVPPIEAYSKAKEYVKKALEIDSTLAEAYSALSSINMIYEWDSKAAEQEVKKALQLDPNSAGIHSNYSMFLRLTKHHEEDILEAKRAMELDPLNSYFIEEYGNAYFYGGQYDKAMEVLKEVVKMNPNNPSTHYALGHVYEGKSMIKEAIEEFVKAVDLSGGSSVSVSSLACSYYLNGEMEKAEKLYSDLEQKSKKEYVPATLLYSYHLIKGDMDKAFYWFEKAIDDHDSFLIFYTICPTKGHRIPDEPRFNELLEKAGMERNSIQSF